MFAVPGWSVASNSLKSQTEEVSKPKSSGATPANKNNVVTSKNKKRKRSGEKPKVQDVNASTLADLWETVIEGKSKKQKTKDTNADYLQNNEKATLANGSGPGLRLHSEQDTLPNEKHKKSKTLKDKKREKKMRKLQESNETSQDSPSKHTEAPQPLPEPQVPTKLTPLQASMQEKLVSARFRHLNQTLYTNPSSHSLELFQQSPEMFQEYHKGFRRQVEVWPENPVTGYISLVRGRGKQRGLAKGTGVTPLPRTEGICHIADLGCGDAALLQALQKDLHKLKLQIHSFDLQNTIPLVTKADIADLPLGDGSVDVAIFCLALMGTNWIDFIEEAFRVLRWKGELWIAEIKSRFGRVAGRKKRLEHSVGNRKRPDKKLQKKLEEDENDEVAMVEVDGLEDPGQETDVTAFVEVLKKRGFVLQGEAQGEANNAVDLSNKMFVKLHFVKGATPIKGKCVPVPRGMEEVTGETWKERPKTKFLDNENVPVSSEAAVLKPCVYKLR